MKAMLAGWTTAVLLVLAVLVHGASAGALSTRLAVEATAANHMDADIFLRIVKMFLIADESPIGFMFGLEAFAVALNAQFAQKGVMPLSSEERDEVEAMKGCYDSLPSLASRMLYIHMLESASWLLQQGLSKVEDWDNVFLGQEQDGIVPCAFPAADQRFRAEVDSVFRPEIDTVTAGLEGIQADIVGAENAAENAADAATAAQVAANQAEAQSLQALTRANDVTAKVNQAQSRAAQAHNLAKRVRDSVARAHTANAHQWTALSNQWKAINFLARRR